MLETLDTLTFSGRMARRRELCDAAQAVLGLIAHEKENGSFTDQKARQCQGAVMAAHVGASFVLQYQPWNKKLTDKMETLRRLWYRRNGIGG